MVNAFALRCVFLTAIWTLLWGDLSLANVLTGVAVSTLLLVVFPAQQRTVPGLGRPRPLGLVRFLLYVLGQFVVSNVLVAIEIVSPRSRVRTGIVACPLRTRSPSMIAFLANVVALTPGTMPVDVETDPPVIYVHVLVLKDVGSARRGIARLESLAVRAFGTAEDIASVSNAPPGAAASRASTTTPREEH